MPPHYNRWLTKLNGPKRTGSIGWSPSILLYRSMLVIAPMSWHGLGVHCPFGRRLDEEANDQETPANGADAEAKSGKPEPEKRETERLEPVLRGASAKG